jgi:YbbR domain-containing protein
LVLSFLLWGFVTWESDPERSRTFASIPITAVGLQPGLVLVGELPTARVTVKGPESVVTRVEATMLSVTADLSDIEAAGAYDIELDVDSPSDVRDVSVVPEEIEVIIDETAQRTFLIDVVQPAPPPPNLTSVDLSVDEVVVSGPADNVDRVASVQLLLDLAGRTESFGADLEPFPVDAGGVVVEGVTVEPSTVHVEVVFEVRSQLVPVLVMCACTSSTGALEVRELTNASAIPSTVRVSGPESLITSLDAVRTVPVDVSDLDRSGFISDVQLDEQSVPEGVTLEQAAVEVYVQIEDRRVSFSQAQISVINLPPEFRAVLAQETVRFEVTGPAEILEEFEGATPTVFVDVAGLAPGTYTLPVWVVLPPELTYLNLEPAEVQVTIVRVEPTQAGGSATPTAPSAPPEESP